MGTATSLGRCLKPPTQDSKDIDSENIIQALTRDLENCRAKLQRLQDLTTILVAPSEKLGLCAPTHLPGYTKRILADVLDRGVSPLAFPRSILHLVWGYAAQCANNVTDSCVIGDEDSVARWCAQDFTCSEPVAIHRTLHRCELSILIAQHTLSESKKPTLHLRRAVMEFVPSYDAPGYFVYFLRLNATAAFRRHMISVYECMELVNPFALQICRRIYFGTSGSASIRVATDPNQRKIWREWATKKCPIHAVVEIIALSCYGSPLSNAPGLSFKLVTAEPEETE